MKQITNKEYEEWQKYKAEKAKGDFLENVVVAGSYGEDWSLRKVLRRFIWHDRIHAKAMY